MFIGRDVVRFFQNLFRNRRRRSRVVDHEFPRLTAQFHRISYRVQRDLILQDQNIRRQNGGLYFIQISRRDTVIRAGHHHDTVILFRNSDHRDAAGYPGHAADGGRIHTVLLQIFDQPVRKGVVAHTAEQGDIAAQPRGGNRLIRALAAGNILEAFCRNRLALSGQTLRLRRQIHIDGTDHRDLFHAAHRLIYRIDFHRQPTPAGNRPVQ